MSDFIEELFVDQPLIKEDNSDPGAGDVVDEGTAAGGEPPAGTTTDSGGEPPERKHVPLAALHEERTRRQQLEQEAQQLRQTQATTMERLTKLLEAQQQAQQPQQQQQQEEVIPDFVEDPEGAFRALQRRYDRDVQEMRQFIQQSQNGQQSQQQYTQHVQAVIGAEREYMKTVPDYPQAFDYFKQQKLKEYTAFVDPALAEQQITQDCVRIAQLAQQLGKNPADLIYKAASNLGYKAGATPPSDGEHRQEPPTSLSNVQGASRAPDEKGGVTAADIANMSEAEFDKYWASMKQGSVVRPKI